jgi:hypothetical protein
MGKMLKGMPAFEKVDLSWVERVRIAKDSTELTEQQIEKGLKDPHMAVRSAFAARTDWSPTEEQWAMMLVDTCIGVRLGVACHPKFKPSDKQIDAVLNGIEDPRIQEVYKARQIEWQQEKDRLALSEEFGAGIGKRRNVL